MIILGIDPGTKRVGFGLLKKDGSNLKFLNAGILKIENSEPQNLLDIETELQKIINRYRPQTLAIEKLFFMKNRKTAIKVAEARGTIIAIALKNGLKIREFSPNEMKAAIAGYGFASKKAVEKMVKLILKQPDLKVIDDAYDALALAILGTA